MRMRMAVSLIDIVTDHAAVSVAVVVDKGLLLSVAEVAVLVVVSLVEIRVVVILGESFIFLDVFGFESDDVVLGSL